MSASTYQVPSENLDEIPPRAVFVIPCFNEAPRLERESFRAMARDGVHLLFVDDGSIDDTAEVLLELAQSSASIECMLLPRNGGKAEAVRQGLRYATSRSCTTVGYLDADLATPPLEMLRLLTALEQDPDRVAALGSRVARLGATIERSNSRHYAGRVFATIASLALGCRVYDTQCGAKVFRVTPALNSAIEAPFRSRWAFDVELLSRLLRGSPGVDPVPLDAFVEIPLAEWREVPGSGISLAAKLRTLGELTLIVLDYHPRWQTRPCQRFIGRRERKFRPETNPGVSTCARRMFP